ncbi:MAG TPA: 2-amino-4-hydroxy-6-hydroxymethyldihydropteridine diphosphokinase [Dissulfurispiraceae bacterium]|nr:2-amino-4-hydroxy-6-hydroxymethyldihydropteridine diphosphokinase [Dissulfurispiraceae bacterium]
MAVVYIGIGSNLGDKEGYCRDAVERMAPEGVRVRKISRPYCTKPWGVEDQPYFVNMAVEAETDLSPELLLSALKKIEIEMGRQAGERWGPRLIDLDILFYGDSIISLPELEIPHPLMHKREFALLPLLEIAPDLLHPVLKASIRQLVNSLAKEERR